MLRKILGSPVPKRKTKKRKKQQHRKEWWMSWIHDRIKERSTHNGVIVAAAAIAVIWGGMALLDIVVWAGLAWGLWNMIKKDD